MISPNKTQILAIHKYMIEKSGGVYGIRDEGLLDSALSSANQTFDGVDLYASIPSKIARIVYSIIKNHPFIDGNKRIGMYVMLILLEANNVSTVFSNEEVVRIGYDLASGKMSYNELLKIIVEKY
jgi:death-on-curing protein